MYSLEDWPNRHEDYIYDWWMSVSHQIPKQAKLEADHWHMIPNTEFMEVYLKHNFPEPVYYGPKNKPQSKSKSSNPSKKIVTRRGLMIGARRFAPRLVPYVGWGILAKDIYDILND